MLNDMRYRIQFQKKKPAGRLPVDGKDSWQTVIECWAKAEGLKGREYYAISCHSTLGVASGNVYLS